MNPREIAACQANLELIKSEHVERKGLELGTAYVKPLLTDDERRKREEAATAATMATIRSEMQPAPVDRTRLEQRLREGDMKIIAAEIAASKSTRSYSNG